MPVVATPIVINTFLDQVLNVYQQIQVFRNVNVRLINQFLKMVNVRHRAKRVGCMMRMIVFLIKIVYVRR
jgi:hypothetical protein